MADELDPVTQSFEADVAEYEAAIEEAAATAQEFAGANEEARLAVDGVRDSAAEAAAAVDVYRDAAGRWRNSAGQFATSAELEAAALGHERDEALEAEVAMRQLRDAEVETAAAGEGAALGGISMMAVGITALIGLIAAVAPAVLALGAGVGGFALFALPALKSVSAAYTQINTDQQAYNRALTATARNTALAHLKADYAALSPQQRAAVEGIQQLAGAYHQLSAAFGPEVFTAFDEGLSIARDLMYEIAPLAMQGAFAVNRMLESLKAGIDSKGFTSFLSMLSRLVLPATDALTRLAGVILGILGQAITQLAPISVPFINMLSDLLRAAGPALVGALKFLAEMLMDIGKAITPLLGPLGKVIGYMANHPIFAQMATAILGIVIAVKLWTIAQAALDAVMALDPFVLIAIALIALAILIATHTHQIAEAFDMVRHVIASWGHDVAAVFDRVRHDISAAFDDVRHTVASWGHDVASVFDRVRHDAAMAGDAIVHPFLATFNWIKANWKMVLAWLVSPIGMAVFEIRTHTKQIAQTFDRMRHDVAAILAGARHDIAAAWDGARHDVAAILAGARHDIASAFDGARHDIAAFADWVPHEIAHLWDEARHYEATALDNIRHDIATAWDNVRHETAVLIDDVLRFFERLPGQVLSFLASLPGKMLSAGENVIKGLINGILNAAAQIPSIMSGLASDVASYFTDPLKLFSPSRLFFEHGYNIVQGLINGVKANAPALLATMHGLGTSVGGTGSALAAGAVAPAGSMSVHVTVPTTVQGATSNAYSDPAFQQFMQREVQEAVLRYGQVNPGNGLTPAWGR